MAQKKESKKNIKAKEAKVRDLKPRKDAKGGRRYYLGVGGNTGLTSHGSLGTHN